MELFLSLLLLINKQSVLVYSPHRRPVSAISLVICLKGGILVESGMQILMMKYCVHCNQIKRVWNSKIYHLALRLTFYAEDYFESDRISCLSILQLFSMLYLFFIILNAKSKNLDKQSELARTHSLCFHQFST